MVLIINVKLRGKLWRIGEIRRSYRFWLRFERMICNVRDRYLRHTFLCITGDWAGEADHSVPNRKQQGNKQSDDAIAASLAAELANDAAKRIVAYCHIKFGGSITMCKRVMLGLGREAI